MKHYAAARNNMVESQIRPNKVTDGRLIEAFKSIPRELFVPDEKKVVAYLDEDVEIAKGRYLMEPMVLARLLHTAAIEASDIVLDMGCGSGYASAVMSKLCESVVAIDPDPALVEKATATLSSLDITNVAVIEGALKGKIPAQGPFDVVFAGGAIDSAPREWTDSLAEGGRLVCVERRNGVGRAILYTRFDGVIGRRILFDAAIPFLPGMRGEPAFQF